MPDSPTLRLRFMQVNDLAQVIAIEAQSFASPWPERSYRFEINQSQVSHMVVLESSEVRPLNGWKRWLQGLRGRGMLSRHLLLGYGGLWRIQEEAHISTIASHPAYRGSGYGELLLAAMVRRALHLGAQYVVLEVRVGNVVAQRLYDKYGFKVTGVKKNYYQKEGEDAYEMRLNLLPQENQDLVQQRYQALTHRHHFVDAYSRSPHPRLGD